MWGWFGGAAAQKRKDTPKNAILTLRSQLDMLQKREKYLQTQMDEQDALARKYVSTNKNAAKTAIKRKKQHEHSLEQTIGQIGTLEQQINAIESANINRETLDAMSKASDAMKQIHGKYTQEKVEEIMDNIQRQNEIGEDILNAITNNPAGNTLDEMELDEELERLQQEQLDEAMLKTGNIPVTDDVHKLPTVASAEPVSRAKQAVEEDDEEAEFRKLQAEMAIS